MACVANACVAILLACGGEQADDSSGAGTGAGANDAGSSGESGTSGASGARGANAGTNAGTNAGANAGAGAGSSGAGGAGDAGSAGNAGTAAGSAGAQAGEDGGALDGGDAGDAGDAGSTGGPLAARVCPQGVSFGDPLPTDRDASLVGGGFVFLEGPVWLEPQGVLLFSDMDMGAVGPMGPASRIRRLTPQSAFDVLVEAGGSNGLALDSEGAVLAASHFEQDLVRVSTSAGTLSPLGLRFEGKRFNSPNDLTVRSDGTVYFTDPDWQLAGRPNETGMTGVYRVSPKLEVSLVIGTLQRPNGITLSPDERTLYVGSSQPDVLMFEVHADGTLGDPTTFASPGGADGMGIDCAGNLYVTAGGEVKVFAPDGSSIGAITLAEDPSNVAFGGAEHKTLYITARTGLYSIELEVPGLPY